VAAKIKTAGSAAGGVILSFDYSDFESGFIVLRLLAWRRGRLRTLPFDKLRAVSEVDRSVGILPCLGTIP
jgi:hypothetical protein